MTELLVGSPQIFCAFISLFIQKYWHDFYFDSALISGAFFVVAFL
jgi:hypothetical protein